MPKYEVEFAMMVHAKAVIEAEDADATWLRREGGDHV